MHTRALLAHTQSTRNRQRQPNTLNPQRRGAKKPLHHKPRNNALHLTNPTPRRIRRETLNQARSREAKQRRKPNIQHITNRPEVAAPRLPLRTPGLATPAAKRLVQVERRRAVAQFDIRQPLRHDIEDRGVEPYRRAHQRDDDPRLSRIIRFGNNPADAIPLACVAESQRPTIPARFPPQLLARGVLHPVDGREVLVALDLGDFLDDHVVSVRGVGDLGVVEGGGGGAPAQRGCEGC